MQCLFKSLFSSLTGLSGLENIDEGLDRCLDLHHQQVLVQQQARLTPQVQAGPSVDNVQGNPPDLFEVFIVEIQVTHVGYQSVGLLVNSL